jgi:hypothetical protein
VQSVCRNRHLCHAIKIPMPLSKESFRHYL